VCGCWLRRRWVVGVGMGGGEQESGIKMSKKQPPKSGLGDRQVGAFSVFGAGHTGGPFIFSRKSRFLRKICRFRGWCNTTPSAPTFSCYSPATHPTPSATASIRVYLDFIIAYLYSPTIHWCYLSLIGDVYWHSFTIYSHPFTIS